MPDEIVTVNGDDSGGGGSNASAIITSLVNANRLESLGEPSNGLSFMLVDRETNTGYLIDYNSLCEAIWSKVFSEEMTEDSIKFNVID